MNKDVLFSCTFCALSRSLVEFGRRSSKYERKMLALEARAYVALTGSPGKKDTMWPHASHTCGYMPHF